MNAVAPRPPSNRFQQQAARCFQPYQHRPQQPNFRHQARNKHPANRPPYHTNPYNQNNCLPTPGRGNPRRFGSPPGTSIPQHYNTFPHTRSCGPTQAVPQSNFNHKTRSLHAFRGQRSNSCQNNMYCQEEDQHSAVDKYQDRFFGDTYGQQEKMYSHEPFYIPIAPPAHNPQDNIYSHKNYDDHDAFHAQESNHIDSYA